MTAELCMLFRVQVNKKNLDTMTPLPSCYCTDSGSKLHPQCKMAFISYIFLLHFCTMGSNACQQCGQMMRYSCLTFLCVQLNGQNIQEFFCLLVFCFFYVCISAYKTWKFFLTGFSFWLYEHHLRKLFQAARSIWTKISSELNKKTVLTTRSVCCFAFLRLTYRLTNS